MTGLSMRTFPRSWPGFLKSVLDATGCKPVRNVAAAVMVGYDVGGRVNRISAGRQTLPRGCNDAVVALARLTLADAGQPTEGTSEYLILPLQEEFVQCTNDGEPPGTAAPAYVGGKIEAPSKTRDLRPVYPDLLLAKRIMGSVAMEGVVSRSGCIHTFRVTRTAHLELSLAALNAASAWGFSPAIVDGQSVAVVMVIQIHFTLG
jgi:TonB family protein